MAYVNVPNDLSKIKTKLAFNLTKRQLISVSVHQRGPRQHGGAVPHAGRHAPGLSAGDV